MKRRAGRRLVAAIAGLLVLAIAVFAAESLTSGSSLPPRPPAERPQLLLLTALPIVFPEGLSLKAQASPALKALQSRYSVIPISIADRSSLDGHRLLLMAQPQAQPGELLVSLDDWVRRGGRVLLLADPALEWPSKRPLGNVLRPPFAFADTGLLAHWGLRLDLPETLGPKSVEADGVTIRTDSPGVLVATGSNCTVEAGFIARCRIGRGAATVVSDADFINAGNGGDSRANGLQLLLRELAELEP